jgi:hypothetical protein
VRYLGRNLTLPVTNVVRPCRAERTRPLLLDERKITWCGTMRLSASLLVVANVAEGPRGGARRKANGGCRWHTAPSDARRFVLPARGTCATQHHRAGVTEADHRDPTLVADGRIMCRSRFLLWGSDVSPLPGSRRSPPLRSLGERARQDLPEHLDAAQDPFLVDVPETENQGRRHVRLACPRGIDPVARQAVYADGAAQC